MKAQDFFYKAPAFDSSTKYYSSTLYDFTWCSEMIGPHPLNPPLLEGEGPGVRSVVTCPRVKSNKIYSLPLFLLSWLAISIFANEEIRFDHVTIENGLSQSSVSSILQDAEGYLWFGTQEGINRYDGYQVKVYKRNSMAVPGLSSNYISALFEDRKGHLWAGSPMGGLMKFDKLSEQFTSYYRKSDSDENAISHNSIVRRDAFFEDSQGHLWIIAYGGGINCFDPDREKFVHFGHRTDDARSLGNDRVVGIAEDRNGVVWIATEGGGLNRFDSVKSGFTRLLSQSELSSRALVNDTLTAMLKDRNGIFWLGYFNGFISRFDPLSGKLRHFSPPADRKKPVYRFAESNKGSGESIWISLREKGLYQLVIDEKEDAHWTHFPAKDKNGKEKTVHFYQLQPDNDGNIWVVDHQEKLWMLDRKSGEYNIFRNNAANRHSIGSESVTTIYKDRGGLLWIGTAGNGAAIYNPAKYKFKHFDLAATEATADAKLVYALSETSIAPFAGMLWAGSVSSGLFAYDANRKQVLNYRHEPGKRNSLINNTIRAIHQDQSGVLWIGTANGLSRIQLDKNGQPVFRNFYSHLENENSPGGPLIRQIVEDEAGIFWLATNNGLTAYDPAENRFTRYLHRKKNIDGEFRLAVFTLYLEPADKGGHLWLGTSNGLYRFDRKREASVRIGEADGLAGSQWIVSIWEDIDSGSEKFQGQRQFWLGTLGGGITRIRFPKNATKANRLTVEARAFSETHGLSNNTAYGILGDQSGYLWISTNKGLCRFLPEAYERKGARAFKVYDTDDGLQSSEFNLGAHFLSPRGEMFFGGVNGFNTFFPDSIRDNPQIPDVLISAFKKFDKPVQFNRALTDVGTVKLHYNENFFSFEFAALTYTNPSKNQYLYQLQGFDTDWVSAGNRRYANYTNVPPGDYLFRVKASNQDGVWNEEAASMRISIAPPFWQAWWFYLLLFAGISAILFAVYKIRLGMEKRRIREIERVKSAEKLKKYRAIEDAKKEERQRVRKKIAADFHDQSGHKLTKISLFCEVMKSQANGNFTPDDYAYLDKITEASNQLHSDMSDFIWSLHPEEDSLYDTGIKLKDFGDHFFERTGIAFRVNGVSKDLQKVPLNMEVRRNLLFIFKEGMNNILRHNHGACQNVRLEIHRQNGHYHIELSDDGKGFDPWQNGSGNGLKNMKARSESIRGDISIESKIGIGTEIKFTGKVNS